jgi:hypothetical protein
MITLTLALAFLSPLAHADDQPALPNTIPQQISVDLDGDGQPDLVQTTDAGDGTFTLTAKLSKDGRTLTVPKLLKKYSESTCGEFSRDEITAGPAGTVLVKNHINDDDDSSSECRYHNNTTATLALVNGELRVQRVDVEWGSWSMGSTAPHVQYTVDFAAGKLNLAIQEHHEFNVDRKASENLRSGCVAASAAEYAAGGIPMCAQLEEKFMYDELFPEDSDESLPTCPALNGAYQCTVTVKYANGKTDSYKQQILVIRRSEGKLNRYDISNDNSLITDGKTRNVKDDDTVRSFQTSSCKREKLTTDQNDFLKLTAGDKRKPLFDRLPWQKKERVWTQLDLTGGHFAMIETEEDLQDNGGYKALSPTTMDCVRQN